MDNKALKNMEDFTYLGNKIKSSDSLDEELVNKIDKVNDGFEKLRVRD